MTIRQSQLGSYRKVGWLGRYIAGTWVLAASNLACIIVDRAREIEAATRSVDGYEITACYFGPPVAFYPRSLVFVFSSIATAAFVSRRLSHDCVTLIGLIGALSAYVYWWVDSYRVFRNFSDAGIQFMNNPGIRQTAYLYQGTWFDVVVAMSIVVCLMMLLDGLFNRQWPSIS